MDPRFLQPLFKDKAQRHLAKYVSHLIHYLNEISSKIAPRKLIDLSRAAKNGRLFKDFDIVDKDDCELLVLNLPLSRETNIRNLPITSNYAYLRCKDELFFINRIKNECSIILPFSPSIRNQFDTHFNLNHMSINDTNLSNGAHKILELKSTLLTPQDKEFIETLVQPKTQSDASLTHFIFQNDYLINTFERKLNEINLSIDSHGINETRKLIDFFFAPIEKSPLWDEFLEQQGAQNPELAQQLKYLIGGPLLFKIQTVWANTKNTLNINDKEHQKYMALLPVKIKLLTAFAHAMFDEERLNETLIELKANHKLNEYDQQLSALFKDIAALTSEMKSAMLTASDLNNRLTHILTNIRLNFFYLSQNEKFEKDLLDELFKLFDDTDNNRKKLKSFNTLKHDYIKVNTKKIKKYLDEIAKVILLDFDQQFGLEKISEKNEKTQKYFHEKWEPLITRLYAYNEKLKNKSYLALEWFNSHTTNKTEIFSQHLSLKSDSTISYPQPENWHAIPLRTDMISSIKESKSTILPQSPREFSLNLVSHSDSISTPRKSESTKKEKGNKTNSTPKSLEKVLTRRFSSPLFDRSFPTSKQDDIIQSSLVSSPRLKKKSHKSDKKEIKLKKSSKK